jgi:hypothetical protein
VVGFQSSLENSKGSLVGVTGGGKIPKSTQRIPEVVEAARDVGMIRAKLGLTDGYGALEGVAGGLQLPKVAEYDPEVAKGGRRNVMTRLVEVRGWLHLYPTHLTHQESIAHKEERAL